MRSERRRSHTVVVMGFGAQAGEILHVTNGDSTGDSLSQTTLGGAVLSWQDVLHEGPVPLLPPDQLREVRAQFLSECGWDNLGGH